MDWNQRKLSAAAGWSKNPSKIERSKKVESLAAQEKKTVKLRREEKIER